MKPVPAWAQWIEENTEARMREKVKELTTVLEMIASLRDGSNPSAAALAKSALDTMRVLDRRNIGAVTPAAEL